MAKKFCWFAIPVPDPGAAKIMAAGARGARNLYNLVTGTDLCNDGLKSMFPNPLAN